jgi:hypothetical protein
MTSSEKDGAEVNHVGELDNSSSDAVLLATAADSTDYSPWTGAMWRLYGVLFVAYLCGMLNGFDGSLMGAINAMKPYQTHFGLWVLNTTQLMILLLTTSLAMELVHQPAWCLQFTISVHYLLWFSQGQASRSHFPVTFEYLLTNFQSMTIGVVVLVCLLARVSLSLVLVFKLQLLTWWVQILSETQSSPAVLGVSISGTEISSGFGNFPPHE